MRVSRAKLRFFDDELYTYEFFKLDADMMKKYGEIDTVYFDDFFIEGKTKLGFKKRISDNLDVDKFIDNMMKAKYPPMYLKEFLEQYEIDSTGVRRKDSYISVDHCSLPILFKIDKDDPDWNLYFDMYKGRR